MPRDKIKRYLDYKKIGDRLMQLRYTGVSREDVAKVLSDNGIDFNGQTLKHYELATEGRYITLENIVALADYYHVSVDYILGRTNCKSTDEDIKSVVKTSHLSENAISVLKQLYVDDMTESPIDSFSLFIERFGLDFGTQLHNIVMDSKSLENLSVEVQDQLDNGVYDKERGEDLRETYLTMMEHSNRFLSLLLKIMNTFKNLCPEAEARTLSIKSQVNHTDIK